MKTTKYTPEYKMRVKGEFKINDALLSAEITQQEAYEMQCKLDEEVDALEYKNLILTPDRKG